MAFSSCEYVMKFMEEKKVARDSFVMKVVFIWLIYHDLIQPYYYHRV